MLQSPRSPQVWLGSVISVWQDRMGMSGKICNLKEGNVLTFFVSDGFSVNPESLEGI